jgi:hypothetical protein
MGWLHIVASTNMSAMSVTAASISPGDILVEIEFA